MPFGDGFYIRCGVAFSGESFAISASALDLDAPYSVILVYEPGVAQPWARQDLEDEITAMCLPPRAMRQDHVAVALSQEGAVHFIGETPLRELIAGAGVWSDDAAGFGPLTDIRLIDDRLYATGFGGQAYVRSAPDRWQQLAPEFPKDNGNTLVFRCVAARSDGSFLLGGYAYDEAALESDDDDNTSITVDYCALWNLAASRWSRIDLETNSVVNDIFATKSGDLVVLHDQGIFTRVQDTEYLTGPEEPDEQTDLVRGTTFRRKTIVAGINQLFILEGQFLIPFEPQLPARYGGILSVQALEDTLWVFDAEGVTRLGPAGWLEIEVPSRLLAIPFEGL